MKKILKSYLLFLVFVTGFVQARDWRTEQIVPLPVFPKGFAISLDFEHIHDGLIPSKSIFPLYVPLGDLELRMARLRRVVMIQHGESLFIPHSSVLDPNGKKWACSVQFYAGSDGLIVSQCNQTDGYAIYIVDGIIHAAIHNRGQTVVLCEKMGGGIGKAFRKRITVVLEIDKDKTFLLVNRTLVAHADLKKAFSGKNFFIQIGENKNILPALKQIPKFPKNGFSGAISAFKIIRQ